jgi:hypothetical protein
MSAIEKPRVYANPLFCSIGDYTNCSSNDFKTSHQFDVGANVFSTSVHYYPIGQPTIEPPQLETRVFEAADFILTQDGPMRLRQRIWRRIR